MSRGDDPLLGEFLRGRDVPCPLCGYNLRDLTTPRCPECGRELRLSVGLVEPFLRAWIAATVASCACAGLGVLFLYIVVREGFPGRNEPMLGAVIVYFIVAIPQAMALLRWRRRFLRVSARLQWSLASICIALAVIAFVSMFATVY